MITQFPDGWHFISDLRDFGPYAEESGAEACRAQYEAFISNAPGCHHGARE